MSNQLVKSVAGHATHYVNLLDEILCHGPDSLSLVSLGHEVCFNAAILCSLSPLISTLVKQSTEDNGCFAHDHIFVLLPELRNWKTMEHLKTFLSSGIVGNIAKLELEDLRNLLQMLGFNISCEEHCSLMQQVEVEGEEEHFFAEIKYEAEDGEEFLRKQDFFTRIRLDRNHYEEMKNLIEGGSGALNDRDIMDVDQEVVEDEDLDSNQGSDGTLTTKVHASGNSNTEIDYIEEETRTKLIKAESKLSTGSKRLANRKISPNVCPKGKIVKKNAKVDRKGDQHQCPKCNYKSGRKWNVKTHYEAVHEEVKYPCSECNYTATHPSHLKLHINAVHKGVKFTCNECDYKGTQLKRHIQSVHNEICYSCSKCDYETTHKRNLVTHNREVHEGVKYPCTKCNFKSTRLNRLKAHEKSVH